jgi:Flp pilus assembly protein TadG
MYPWLIDTVRGALHGRRGIASLEFAMTMGAIIVIVLGTYDVGNYVLQEMKLTEAVDVGGQYAVSYPADTNGMKTAVAAALPASWTVAATPVMNCKCATGGTETDADCTVMPVCPLGQTTERFITITLTRAYSPLLIGALTSTTASYVARVQ